MKFPTLLPQTFFYLFLSLPACVPDCTSEPPESNPELSIEEQFCVNSCTAECERYEGEEDACLAWCLQSCEPHPDAGA